MANIIRVILYMILFQLLLEFSGSVSFGEELIFKRFQPTLIEVKVDENLHWERKQSIIIFIKNIMLKKVMRPFIHSRVVLIIL